MPSLWAVLFYSSADPAKNTSPPPPELAASAWGLQGAWGSFVGTPVAPYYFLTAAHIGGQVGDAIIVAGQSHLTVSRHADPQSDLALWKVDRPFAAYADLYPRLDESSKTVVVFGRGTQRGAEVWAGGLFGSKLRGWQWGEYDGRLRWGENQVGSVAVRSLGNGVQVEVLRCYFNANAGANEAHLSNGDSGGGLFIQDNGVWKLAGINLSVDGPYNTTPSGPGFSAAIFDEGALYTGGEGRWQQQPDLLQQSPGSFYATRVSTRLSWIQSIISSASGASIAVLSAPVALGPYGSENILAQDTSARTITVARPSTGLRFYRLTADRALRIKSVQTLSDQLVLTYE